ncbi:MAG: phosphonate C-P lyase system protein PhnH [Eubacteriales bacterium]
MFKENPFDPVFDCQQVFKTLMNALARPGTIVSMEKNVEKLEGENAALLAAGLALLDNWRRFCVCGDPQLEKELRELTYGVPDVLSEADYSSDQGADCRAFLPGDSGRGQSGNTGGTP